MALNKKLTEVNMSHITPRIPQLKAFIAEYHKGPGAAFLYHIY